MPSIPFYPTIDYTSRDYLALRADMIDLIRGRLPGWTAENPSDFGLALVEAFAYGMDIVHFYLDRMANEAYLPTAQQRDSLYALAEMFNYTPRLSTPAYADLTFTNATDEDVVLPAGTRCQATVSTSTGTTVKNFEVISERLLPGKRSAGQFDPVSTGPVGAAEGRTYKDETIGVSDGFVKQEYFLLRTSVLPNTVTVTTTLGTVVTDWAEISDLSLAGPYDYSFQALRQTDESTLIRFGDGAHGRIPELHATIAATYRVGGGEVGNVPAHTISAIVEPVLYGITVTNQDPAKFGTDPESLDSIRVNAARSFRSRERAVTVSDFNSLARAHELVAKAKTIGNNASSVTIFVSPNNDGTGQPTLSSGDAATIKSYIESRSMAGVTTTVLGCSWIPVYMELKINCHDSAYQSDVEAEVRRRMGLVYGFDNVDFNGVVAMSSAMTALLGVPGMDWAEVTKLSLNSTLSPASTATIELNSPTNAIPFFDATDTISGGGTLNVVVTGGLTA